MSFSHAGIVFASVILHFYVSPPRNTSFLFKPQSSQILMLIDCIVIACARQCPLSGLVWETDEGATSSYSWNVSRVGEQ